MATPSGVSKVSTIRRMASDRRWSAQMVRAIAGSPGEPVPGVSGRRITAFAKRNPETGKTGETIFVPMQEPDPDIRAAHITKEDLETHGGTERCPGCRALATGKYRAKHTLECRKRFEPLLTQTESGKRRVESAHNRKMEAITKLAMQHQEAAEAEAAPADRQPDSSMPSVAS